MQGNLEHTWETYVDKALDLLFKSPKMIFLLFSAWFSGSIWVYIYYAYIKKEERGTDLLFIHVFKIAIGVAWHAPFLILTYLLTYHGLPTSDMQEAELSNVILLAILLAQTALCACIFVLAFLGKRS